MKLLSIVLIFAIVMIAVIIALVLSDDFVKVAQEEIWLYKATREPSKYSRCIDCDKVKPHKIMDTNTGICDDCGLIRGLPKNK